MQLAEKKVSSNINDFILPPMNLPPDWTFAITNGLIYYYHVKIRIPQWERPIFFAPLSVDEKTVKVDKFENQDNNLETRLKLETNDVNYDGESFLYSMMIQVFIIFNLQKMAEAILTQIQKVTARNPNC